MCIVCSAADTPEGTCPECGTLMDTPYVGEDGIMWCSERCAAPYYQDEVTPG